MKVELENLKYFRGLDWGRLKGFYYVAKEKNLTNAARYLKLTQPAMSRQISSFEKQLGYPLVIRTTTGVQLTRKGEQLFEIAERLFMDIKELSYANQDVKHEGEGRKIRIISTHAVCSYILNDLIIDYTKEHPELIIELISEEHLIDIHANDVDIAIRPYDAKAQHVQQEQLLTLQKKLYASEEYIEKYGEPSTVEDLKNHRLISIGSVSENYPYSDIHWILKLGMPKGKQRTPHFMSTSIECAIRAAEKGVGIVSSYEEMSIIKESNLRNVLPNVKSEEIKDYIIYPNYLKEDKEILRIKNYLLSKLNDISYN